MGDAGFGIDPAVLSRLADDVRELAAAGAQLGLVIGGGNIFRGAGLAAAGMDRVTGDQLGMLATVMNALAMRDALESRGVPARVLSALRMDQVCETYTVDAARRHLAAGRVALFAAGTGNPFFTTDSAAPCGRSRSAPTCWSRPRRWTASTRPTGQAPRCPLLPRLSYDRAVRENLGVMDLTAILLCRDHGLPMRVMNITRAARSCGYSEGRTWHARAKRRLT